MHRASSNQLLICKAPIDILDDCFKPVDSMLYRRGSNIEVILDCPEGLIVETDGLRVKQIMLNLGRNSSKFVQQGFIRLRAAEVNGMVQLSVEDSGPGIPVDKRGRLFAKFQESLDSLSQGTGIGLNLCKNLAELLGGDIWLDETYHSGIENCPGTRLVIDLNCPRKRLDDSSSSLKVHQSGYTTEVSTDSAASSLEDQKPPEELPKHLRVLFVDDDVIVRKLFCRSVKRVGPDWTIHEASNGETALRLVEEEEFDLIFMDMYMASVEKQLLGTEAVRELRAKGVKSRICGFSANDTHAQFLEAGADAFMMKPFPCQPEALKQQLLLILKGR
jgi:CheY-like chemotaxis protein